MKLDNLETYLVATTVSDGNGRFHPALRHGLHVKYWPNVKFYSETTAHKVAQGCLNDALDAFNRVAETWALESLT